MGLAIRKRGNGNHRYGGLASSLRAGIALLCICFAAMAGASDSPIVTGFPSTGAYTARFVADNNTFAIVELSGNYDRDTSAGIFNRSLKNPAILTLMA